MKYVAEDEEGKVEAKDIVNDEFNHNIEVTEDEGENKLLLKLSC